MKHPPRPSRVRLRGANMVEYLVIVGVIALAAIVGFSAFGGDTRTLSATQAGCVEAMACGQGGSFPSSSVNAGSGAPGAAQGGASRGIGSQILSFGKGLVVDGLWGTVKGLGQLAWGLATHPVDTTVGVAKGIGYVAMHPVDAGRAFGHEIAESWRQDPARTLGNGVFQLASLAVPVSKVGTAAKVAEAAEGAADAAKVAEAATVAGRGTRLGEGAFSVAYRDGDKVEKVLKDSVSADGGKTFHAMTPAEKDWLAQTTTEFHNEVSDALGKDIVPPLENKGGGVLRQDHVDGKTLEELSKTDVDAYMRALDAREAAIHTAERQVGLDHGSSGVFENGWKLKIDENPQNFRFNNDGSLKGWFDPVAIFPP